jgi:lipid A 3-O-deacylase
MPSHPICSAAFLFVALALPAAAQSSAPPSLATAAIQSSSSARIASNAGAAAPSVQDLLRRNPWNYGAFFNGGVGVGDRSNYSFLSVGARAGKVLTDPIGPGLLRGQFEYSAEILPWWQASTPRFDRYFLSTAAHTSLIQIAGPYPTGGTYTGASITPIILRWDLTPHGRLLPFVQGAGGLIWTNHKFPPTGPFSAPGHQGTSVFNFTPQFGVGFEYFVKPRQSITFNANAVHISNASLGDSNPGVNASVQFQLGYTWWK